MLLQGISRNAAESDMLTHFITFRLLRDESGAGRADLLTDGRDTLDATGAIYRIEARMPRAPIAPSIYLGRLVHMPLPPMPPSYAAPDAI
jgi:hypothetical protein